MKNEIISEIKETFDQLITVFSSFEDEEIDHVPFEDSWTPGQVAEHIIKSISNLPQFFNDKTESTSRPYDENCAKLRQIFLDFGTKMKSPDFIIPLETSHEKKAQLNSFGILKQQMLEAAENLDLTATCKSFEMPGFGFLTRIEWLTFFIVHTKRHVHQLQKIHQVIHN